MYCDPWPYVLWPLDFQIQKIIVSAETIWGNTVFEVVFTWWFQCSVETLMTLSTASLTKVDIIKCGGLECWKPQSNVDKTVLVWTDAYLWCEIQPMKCACCRLDNRYKVLKAVNSVLINCGFTAAGEWEIWQLLSLRIVARIEIAHCRIYIPLTLISTASSTSVFT